MEDSRNYKTLNLVQEELLSGTVRNYPVLYDKSHEDYKEFNAVKKAWVEVANSLEFMENGTEIFTEAVARRCSIKYVLRNFAKFTGNMCQSLKKSLLEKMRTPAGRLLLIRLLLIPTRICLEKKNSFRALIS